MNSLERDSLIAKIVAHWPGFSETDIDDYTIVLDTLDYHAAKHALNYYARQPNPPFADEFYNYVMPKGIPLMTESARQYGLAQVDRLRQIWAQRHAS